MGNGDQAQPRESSGVRATWRETSWARHLSPHTGLQGKLVMCVIFMMAAALGVSCWLFASEGQALLDRVAGDQATQIGRTLALASETAMQEGDRTELSRVGADLMKNRSIVAVAFHDTQGTLLAASSHDKEIERAGSTFFGNPKDDPQHLRQIEHRSLPSLGRYIQLTTPVTKLVAGEQAARGSTPRVVGYVTVCISTADHESRIRGIQLTVVLIGAVAILVSIPVTYGLVHRIFHPIRQLVVAADKIAAGDLDTRVDIDRPDVIGTLARSFNEMVIRVKQQKDDLAEANEQLESTNDRLEKTNVQLAEANEQLEHANHDLEEKVRQRTVQLEATAAQLEAANRRLSSEIAEKEDFLRAVSHDLNAPLRNISGMAAMLLMKHRDTFDEDVVHRLERIQKNVEVETDLIGELLELSRIKTRRQKMEQVELSGVVQELGEVFAQDLESRQIDLVVDTPLPALDCERARMRQVFQNLIDNAIKYMGEGSTGGVQGSGHESSSLSTQHSAPSTQKQIHVGCTIRAGEVEFYVRDTGIGIEADDLDKVFRVFRRGKHQAVQSVAGKGVGLASVKSIIETYNGTIWVESQIGRGSTFRFTINGRYVVPAGQVAQEGAQAA